MQLRLVRSAKKHAGECEVIRIVVLVSENLFTLLCNKAQTCICFNAASKMAIAFFLLNKV
jgi:hypothetical protein